MNHAPSLQRRSGRKTGGVLALVLALSLTAIAGQPPSADFVGSAVLDGSTNHMTWKAWFDVPLEQAVARMTAWPHAHVFVADATNFELRSHDADGAIFYVEREVAAWLPNMKMVLQAQVKKREGAATRILWTQLEGPADKMKRTWTLKAAAGGTWIEHDTLVTLPFSPPAFLFGDPNEKLASQVEAARVRLGANVTLRSPPLLKVQSKVSPLAPARQPNRPKVDATKRTAPKTP